MKPRTSYWLLLVIAAFAVAAPMLIALVLAHKQAMDEEVARAEAIAQEVLQRTEELARQAYAAERDVLATTDPKRCSTADVRLLREVVLSSSYLELVGHVDQGGNLVCSSLGRHEPPLELGPAEHITALGVEVHHDVDLGLDDERFLIVQKGTFVAAVRPLAVLNLYLEQPDLSVGVLTRSQGRALSVRGPFDPLEENVWGAYPDKETHFNGQYLRALKHSELYDLTAYAIVPGKYLKEGLADLMMALAPTGGIIGLALGLALVWLARRHNSLPSILKAGLRGNEFAIHYQPIVELGSGKIKGFEALLRWSGSGAEPLRPESFIPVAEDCGLIGEFTRFVMGQVARDAPQILKRYPQASISINLAAKDLERESLIDSIVTLINTASIQPQDLMFEVTEHSLIQTETAAEMVRRIRSLGVKVAIDDFGTGYSCLANLAELEVDCLKIDKKFVGALDQASATNDVLLHIINIARSLNLSLVAEGVEKKTQADFLIEHDVRLAQGWLYYPALPVSKLPA